MSLIPLIFVILIILVTVGMGILATKKSKTASDFFVAGRSVGVVMNASAISGEYLSAASFMGVAALVMKNGYDALWYPVGYAAGYLFLLLFIAGPLRRFGAYTIPDFAEGRFDSSQFRKIAVTFVLFIGFFYTMPQMKGAGVTMSSILNWPYWAGILVVGTVITFNVALGGMKGITLVQAFQYWAKVFAISVPVFVLMAVYGKATPSSALLAMDGPGGQRIELPRMPPGTTVKVKGSDAFPANVINLPVDDIVVSFPKGAKIAPLAGTGKSDLSAEQVRKLLRGGMPFAERVAKRYERVTDESLFGRIVRWNELDPTKPFTFPAGSALVVAPFEAQDETGWSGDKPLRSLKLVIEEPTELQFFSVSPTGDAAPAAPNAPPDNKWLNPFGPLTSKHGYPLLYTYSLIIALVCGTAGLPHILVRFYTNPDGRAAKRTTLWVMVMLGGFYVFTPIWGALGRAVMPQLYANNGTDALLIKLPTTLQNPLLGQILSGITSAGAFAAFMSTFSGLLVSMSGAFAHDIYGRILRPKSEPHERLVAFKVAAVVVGALSMGLGLLVESFDIAMMVGWAFAIGAASYFPLLLLGSWWRGLTRTGAASGMLLGGLLSLSAIVTFMLLDKKVITADVSPLVKALLEQPAIWGVPLSLLTMWLVSNATKSQVPSDVNTKMLRLHAPEETGLQQDYINH